MPCTWAPLGPQGRPPCDAEKLSTNRLPVGGNFLLQPNQTEESYPATIYLLGLKRGSLLPKKSCFLLLKPGSVFQRDVLRKGNRVESFAEIYLSDAVRGWGSVAGAGSPASCHPVG